MKKYLILVILLVFLAGCVSNKPATVDANNGLAINEFSADPASVRANDPVLFFADIENVGGTTAQNAQLDLFGVENQWFSGSSLVDNTRTKILGTLTPPDVTLNKPGQEKFVQDDLTPPNPGQGNQVLMQVTARVTYDYNTSGYIDIPAISDKEFERRQINKQPLELIPVIANSAGPIHMTMDSRSSQIIVDTSSAGEDEQIMPVRIVFANVGSGFPITTEDDGTIRGAGGKITGTIQLLGPGAEFDDCLGVTGGNFINLDSTDIALRIRQSNSVTMGCSVRINKADWADRPVDSVKIIFSLFYRYYVDKTAAVTVTGTA